jgi:hypothetical protein
MKNINSISTNSQAINSKLNNIAFGVILVVFLTILSAFSSNAQKCTYNISVKNNIESVNKEGRVYFMELQNNSSDEIEVKLSVFNKNSEKNPDNTATKNNVFLTATFLNETGNDIEGKLVLKPYELLNFQVKVTVPAGTPIERWNNLLVNAISDKCPTYSPSLTLYTFIPNPDEQ